MISSAWAGVPAHSATSARRVAIARARSAWSPPCRRGSRCSAASTAPWRSPSQRLGHARPSRARGSLRGAERPHACARSSSRRPSEAGRPLPARGAEHECGPVHPLPGRGPLQHRPADASRRRPGQPASGCPPARRAADPGQGRPGPSGRPPAPAAPPRRPARWGRPPGRPWSASRPPRHRPAPAPRVSCSATCSAAAPGPGQPLTGLPVQPRRTLSGRSS